MASLKKLAYIFIPILAVLLMSHNTFALGRTFTPYTCYDIVGQGIQCGNYAVTTGNTIQVISVSKSNNSELNNVNFGDYFLWALNIRSYGTPNTQLGINLANGYPEMAIIEDIEQDCNTTNGYTSCNVLVAGVIRNNNWNIQLAGQVTGFGSSYTIDSLYFSSSYDYNVSSNSNLVNISSYLRQILENLNNNPAPTAQDIADAVNAPEEKAVENIENQTTDDYEMQSANMSSLFSQFGAFITAVQGASIGDCNIPANLNHLNLGILDMCANPVPDYAQVAVSIIVCMLIAPYLLNIIKRIIGIADKVREV